MLYYICKVIEDDVIKEEEKMKETYKTLVKVYNYKGNEFAIIKGLHDGIIRAINYKYLNADGMLIKPLNGLEMFCNSHANTVEEIITRINEKIDFDEFLNERGLTYDFNDAAFLSAVKEFYGF